MLFKKIIDSICKNSTMIKLYVFLTAYIFLTVNIYFMAGEYLPPLIFNQSHEQWWQEFNETFDIEDYVEKRVVVYGGERGGTMIKRVPAESLNQPEYYQIPSNCAVAALIVWLAITIIPIGIVMEKKENSKNSSDDQSSDQEKT